VVLENRKLVLEFGVQNKSGNPVQQSISFVGLTTEIRISHFGKVKHNPCWYKLLVVNVVFLLAKQVVAALCCTFVRCISVVGRHIPLI